MTYLNLPTASKITPLERAVLDSASFSIIATDERGIIQLFNQGAEHLLGYTAAEVINRFSPCAMHDPAEVAARAEALSQELQAAIAPGFEALAFKASRGLADIYELTQIRKDGSRFPCIISITALRGATGSILGYLLIGTDSSLKNQAQAERNLALDMAEQAMAAKARFLTNMSHELRTPLNSILGFAQLIDTGTPSPTPRQKRSLDQIVQAGWYLLELINQVLELNQLESGNLALYLEAVDLTEVLQECQAMVAPLAAQRGIKPEFPASLPQVRVRGDRIRIKQVLLNLLSNAIKYNRQGGKVNVSWQILAEERLRLAVTDSGPGLSPEQVAQLFQPFNRLGREQYAEEGTGIGLVMTKYLMEKMGGEIGLTSHYGEGCTFWVEFRINPCNSCSEIPCNHSAVAL